MAVAEIETEQRVDAGMGAREKVRGVGGDAFLAGGAGPAVSRLLAVVLVVGLLLRLGIAAWLHGEPLHIADEQDYDAIAGNLVERGEYAIVPGSPTSIRPPLFPAIVAGLYKMAGTHNFTVVRIVNALLGSATAFVIFLLARRLYDARVGLIAAAICAFYPSLIATGGLVLTETLFTLLVCVCCLLMERYLTSEKVVWLAGLGVVLALAALTRSVLWLFPAPLVLFMLACDRSKQMGRRAAHAGIAVLAFAVVLAPWTVRNTQLQKTFITVDVMGGRNLMMGNYEHTPLARPWAAIEIAGDEAWHQVLRRRYPEKVGKLTQGQLDKLAMKYAVEYVLAHPGQTAARDVLKFAHFWQLEREIVSAMMRGYWGNVPKPAILLAAAAILGAYGLVMLLGVLGVAVAAPANWRMHVFMLLLIAFICALHTLVFGHSRYHLPLMPLVGVYAAASIAHWRDVWARRRSVSMVLASLACLLLVGYWGFELTVEAARF